MGLVALAFGSVLTAGEAGADPSEARLRAAVDTAVRPLLGEHGAPGLAVAVTVNGEARFFAYGVASKQTKAPVTETTLFEIGSVSKPFTATLTGYAEALGKLSLEDGPGQYLPELRGSPIDRATLLHLGTYTAGGLPLQAPEDVKGDAGMASYLRAWKPQAEPGATRRYSNPSIGLLGRVAGLALGGGFASAMETQLLPALGLRTTFIRVPATAKVDYAWGYDKADKPVRVNPGLLGEEAYGIKSTAADMIRFVQANIEPGRLDGPVRRAIEATHLGHFRVGPMVQGLGWEQYPYPVSVERLLSGNAAGMIFAANPAERLAPPQVAAGPTLFNKTGSTNGFGAYAAFVPARRIGLVILANRNVPIPARIRAAHVILEHLDPALR
jgi:beta-lactamase class C